MSPQPDMLLRERIEDTTDASLARFNVRWVIGLGRSPMRGDPATEIQLGWYHIREVAAWDGKFARIERGTGEVTVTRLDDRGVCKNRIHRQRGAWMGYWCFRFCDL